jgi:hypothetical protein
MELVEGAGGTLLDLASLFLLHMKCTILTSQSLVEPDILFNMFGLSVLWMHVLGDHDGPVNQAFISCGIIKAEIAALCSFIDSVTIHGSELITNWCFPHLLNLFMLQPQFPKV